MELIIENCIDIKDYLKYYNVSSVDDLTEKQVLAWAKAGKMGLTTELSVDIVENGLFGQMPDRIKAIAILRQAIKEHKEFQCVFIDNESSDGPNDCDSYFEMSVL